MAREYKDVVVGLDIGTAKIMAVVAEILPGGTIPIVGTGNPQAIPVFARIRPEDQSVNAPTADVYDDIVTATLAW